MATRRHVLVMIHGITPEQEPVVETQYEDFEAAVERAGLPVEFPICKVSWGVPGAGGAITRPDQYLSPAEAFVASLVKDKLLADDTAQRREPVPGSDGVDWGVPLLRGAIRYVRESVVQYGLSDALYYAAPEGERAVRDAVFSQVFGTLEANDDSQVEVHIVAHSLGVTIAHDFLYALFGSDDPTFPDKPGSPDELALRKATRELQLKWRVEAKAGRLKLGSFISFASQLPLFVMRKQALVERLAKHQKLDPSVIGIDVARKDVQWAIFYDSDELLGFATRALYLDTPAIVDIHMNSGIEPLSAHLGYWHKPAIIERAIAILRQNMR